MIHETAVISKKAEIAENVDIGPYTVIGDEVKIGRGTKIASHVVINGPTTIGTNCNFFQFASIGEIPQDLKFKGERTELILGNNNTIREYVTLNRGTEGGGRITSLGDNNLIMAYCHIAHDCTIGNNIIMSNGATLAGHIIIEDHAIIGGLTGIHQFVRIGSYAMIGGLTAVPQDVPPYVISAGERAKLNGINIIGLKRNGFSPDVISELKAAYRIFFRSRLTIQKAIQTIEEEGLKSEEVQYMIHFILKSERGVLRK
ncbi:MAG: acyl-ACP--UDP-N-acetylglucosamine O-acyltransferase [Pseudomonadota bacterium]